METFIFLTYFTVTVHKEEQTNFVREKNKLLSKSISWSIEPKYAIKKTVRVPKLAGGGSWRLGIFPKFDRFFFMKASLIKVHFFIQHICHRYHSKNIWLRTVPYIELDNYKTTLVIHLCPVLVSKIVGLQIWAKITIFSSSI